MNKKLDLREKIPDYRVIDNAKYAWQKAQKKKNYQISNSQAVERRDMGGNKEKNVWEKGVEICNNFDNNLLKALIALGYNATPSPEEMLRK